jgi:hypothetical protein
MNDLPNEGLEPLAVFRKIEGFTHSLESEGRLADHKPVDDRIEFVEPDFKKI